MKPYKAYAHIYSLNGEMDEISGFPSSQKNICRSSTTSAVRSSVSLPNPLPT